MSAEGEKHPRYWLVMAALAVMTIIEVVVALYQGDRGSTRWVAVMVFLVVLAFVKAGCVGLYFMHLISEKTAFICIVCFPLILAVVLVIGLIPDIALG